MKSRINLLPTSYRRQQLLRRRAVQWGSILCGVLVTGWGWHWYELAEDRVLAHQLEVLEREHAPTQRLLKQLVDMRTELEQLQYQSKVAGELESQRSVLTLLGIVSHTAQETDGRLRLTQLDLMDFQAAGLKSGPAARESDSGLKLSGVSIDNPSVGEMLEGLQNSGIFSRVELIELKEREEGDTSLRDYQVHCEF